MTDFYCPLPFKGLYWNTNSSAVCCASSKRFPLSPDEFLKSFHIKKLRYNFINGIPDSTCEACQIGEASGFQSIRKHIGALYEKDDHVVELDHMELRVSNLCNLACIMCDKSSSSIIAGEVYNISDEHWQQILKISVTLNSIILTGGEPFITKKYYELLDHLIEKNRTHIRLGIFTNATVYNPIFVEKMLKFKTRLSLSIDGVGKTAETQRVGTNWKIVNKNVKMFLTLPVYSVKIHTTITIVSILDMFSLAKYYLELLEINKSCDFVIHTVKDAIDRVSNKNISILYMNKEEATIALDQVEKSLAILTEPNFDQVRIQLESYKQICYDKLNV